MDELYHTDQAVQLSLFDVSFDTPKTVNSRRRKQCAHPSCEAFIHRTSTYCRIHFRTAPEIKARRSASAKKRANTPEGKTRMSKAAKAQVANPFQGRTHTEETKTIIKEKRALQVITPEAIKKSADAKRGKPNLKKKGQKHSNEAKTKISKGLQAKSDHLSQKAKERYANETEEQRHRRLDNWIEAGQKQQKQSNTSIEIFVAQYLDSLGIEYEAQKKISYYIVDFCIPNKKNNTRY